MTKTISQKPLTQHSAAVVLARLGARKISKKRAYSKQYKNLWLSLKVRLANSQQKLDAALDAGNEIDAENAQVEQDEVLTEMRSFVDYKFTNTGKKYGVE